MNRPDEIDEILNSLSRFNPEQAGVLHEYVLTQCATGSYDLMANLALLRLYQFNPELTRDDAIVNILAKSLTVFPSPDFSLAVHLLPPGYNSNAELVEVVERLSKLNTLLECSEFAEFWRVLDVDEEYADLVADVVGFEQQIRRRVANSMILCMRRVSVDVAVSWLNFKTRDALVGWARTEVPEWAVDKDELVFQAPDVTETAPSASSKVKFEQLSRLIRRVYENELVV